MVVRHSLMPVPTSLELPAGLSVDLTVYSLALLLRRAQGAAPVKSLEGGASDVLFTLKQCCAVAIIKLAHLVSDCLGNLGHLKDGLESVIDHVFELGRHPPGILQGCSLGRQYMRAGSTVI